MTCPDSSQEISSIPNEPFEITWDFDDLDKDGFQAFFDEMAFFQKSLPEHPDTVSIIEPLNSHPVEIRDENNLAEFIESYDYQKIMEARLCLCQCILRCYMLSLSSLIPLMKLSLKITNYETQLLTKICQHDRYFGPDEPHAFFCQSDQFYECIRDIVGRKSVLNIINLSVMTTYYCSRCQYQKILHEDGPFIISEPCYYLSENMVKQRWVCPQCKMPNFSLVEHKINPDKTMTAYMVFTLCGIKSMRGFFYHTKNPQDIHVILKGWFNVRYVVVETEGKYRIFEYKNYKWLSYSSSPKLITACDTIPFRSEDIRIIVWHHSKPYIVAKSVLTVKKIKEFTAAQNASTKTSDTSSFEKDKSIQTKIELPPPPKITWESMWDCKTHET